MFFLCTQNQTLLSNEGKTCSNLGKHAGMSRRVPRRKPHSAAADASRSRLFERGIYEGSGFLGLNTPNSKA